MLADALAALTKLVREADKPIKIESDDPTRDLYLVGGKEFAADRGVAPRRHAVDAMGDLVALAERFATEAAELPKPVVWYDADAVTLVIDDAGHRAHQARMELRQTQLFQRVAALHRGGPYEHREFLRLLRVDLAGALPPAALLEKVKRVDFENGTVVRARAGRADESLGREITGKVTANEELPETVVLRCQVWRGLSIEAAIPCAVEVDAMRGTLDLVPLPDAVADELDAAVDLLGKQLRAALPEPVPCYRGRP